MQEPGPGILRIDKANKWKDDFVLFYEVEKGGMTSLDGLYTAFYHWFDREMFVHAQSKDSRIEDFYLQRMRPDGVQENLIWWRAYRPVGGSSPWVVYFCKVDWQNFGAKETEIEYNGKKVKTHKLGVVLRITWWVQYDPWNKWEKSILGNMKKWFFTYLMDDEMENHSDKVREIAKRQENYLKNFFEIGTDTPQPRSFFPEEGYKWDKPKPKPEEFSHLQRAQDPKI